MADTDRSHSNPPERDTASTIGTSSDSYPSTPRHPYGENLENSGGGAHVDGGDSHGNTTDGEIEGEREGLLRRHLRGHGLNGKARSHGYGSVGADGKAAEGADGESDRLRLQREPSATRRRRVRREKRKQQWAFVQKRSAYYIPILDWLPNYSFSLFWGDLISALTLASLLVPQSMSYASGLAKLDPVNGLFGSSIPGFVYSVLGTCRQLSVGPEAALSLLVGQTIRTILASERAANHGRPSSPEHDLKVGIWVSTLITFEVGVITFLLGLFRLGFLDCVLSRPLLRGFITAVGVVIFVEQLIPMLGLQVLEKLKGVDHGTTIEKAAFILEYLGESHKLTTLVSFVAIVVLVGARLLKPRLSKWAKWVVYLPEVLLVVVVATGLTDYFDWDRKGVAILGKVDTGKVSLHFPLHHTLKYFKDTVSTAITISIIGFVDSIVAAKQNGSYFNYAISPNRELVALGAANIAASCVSGTIPGYGSITRSRLNANTGARTQMSAFLCSLIVLLSTFFLLQYLFYLPKCILATVICLVVYSIIVEAPHDVMFFWKMKAWGDLGLMTLTFLLTIFWNVQVGITVSIAISLVLVIKESSHMRIRILGRVPGTKLWEPVEDDYEQHGAEGEEGEEDLPGLLVVRIREPLTFANTGALKERLRRLERYGHAKHHPSDAPSREEAKVIIFNMTDVEEIDASALQILSEVVETYVVRDVQVHFTHLSSVQRMALATSGILKLIGPGHVHPKVEDALQAFSSSAISHGTFEV